MTVLETKASACAKLAEASGLNGTIPWAAIIQAIIAALSGCGIAPAKAVDHMNSPDNLDLFVIRRQCRPYAGDREEMLAMSDIIVRQGRAISHTEALALFTGH